MDADDGPAPDGAAADLQPAPDLIDVTGGVEPAETCAPESGANASFAAAGASVPFEEPVSYNLLASPASNATSSASASIRCSVDEHSPDAFGARRHSQRSVKRRRFDDELVESSLVRHHEREKAGGGSTTARHRSLHVGNGDCSGAGAGGTEAPLVLASPIISDAHAASSVSALHLALPATPLAPTRRCSLSIDTDGIDSSVTTVVASAVAATSAATAATNPALASALAAGAANAAPKRKPPAKGNADTRSKINRRKSLPKNDNLPIVISAIEDTTIEAVARDQERWKAQDDFLLIQAIQQLSDLAAVHTCVKFSSSFSLRDIQERWYALLYDRAISKRARNCIRQLPADVLTNLRRRAPFSSEEEAALGSLPSSSPASTEAFEELLREYATAFNAARTARCLRRHWLLLRHYRLLPDQITARTSAAQSELRQQQPVVAASTCTAPAVTAAATAAASAAASMVDLHRSGGDAAAGVTAASAAQLQIKNCSEYQFSFSDAEEAAIKEADSSGPAGSSAADAISGLTAASSDQEKRLARVSAKYELALADRRQKREIRRLEAELPVWRTLISSSIEEAASKDFDDQTLAVLRGQLVRYLMRSRKVTFGRVTADNVVDIDLSLEGPSHKVSRQQGSIQLLAEGEFLIENRGQRPLYVDGRPVATGMLHRLTNNSVVEICTMRFVFFTNPVVVQSLRSQSGKITDPSSSLLPAGVAGHSSEAV